MKEEEEVSTEENTGVVNMLNVSLSIILFENIVQCPGRQSGEEPKIQRVKARI